MVASAYKHHSTKHPIALLATPPTPSTGRAGRREALLLGLAAWQGPVLYRAPNNKAALPLTPGTALVLFVPLRVDLSLHVTRSHTRECDANSLSWTPAKVPDVRNLSRALALRPSAACGADIFCRPFACVSESGLATSAWALRSGLLAGDLLLRTSPAPSSAAFHSLSLRLERVGPKGSRSARITQTENAPGTGPRSRADLLSAFLSALFLEVCFSAALSLFSAFTFWSGASGLRLEDRRFSSASSTGDASSALIPGALATVLASPNPPGRLILSAVAWAAAGELFRPCRQARWSNAGRDGASGRPRQSEASHLGLWKPCRYPHKGGVHLGHQLVRRQPCQEPPLLERLLSSLAVVQDRVAWRVVRPAIRPNQVDIVQNVAWAYHEPSSLRPEVPRPPINQARAGRLHESHRAKNILRPGCSQPRSPSPWVAG